jgi:hypothetical protein
MKIPSGTGLAVFENCLHGVTSGYLIRGNRNECDSVILRKPELK